MSAFLIGLSVFGMLMGAWLFRGAVRFEREQRGSGEDTATAAVLFFFLSGMLLIATLIGRAFA